MAFPKKKRRKATTAMALPLPNRHRLLAAGVIILIVSSFWFSGNLGYFVLDNAESKSHDRNRTFLDNKQEQSGKYQSSTSRDVTFKGSNKLLSLLRKAHNQKIANPQPHCRNVSTKLRPTEIRRFFRAIEVDWIGRNLSSVEPTWSPSDASSCQFAALAFPPSHAAVEKVLRQRTFVSSFYTASQCGTFDWDRDSSISCDTKLFGGTLGGITQEKCIKESADGNPVNLWLQKNLNGAPLECLKLLLNDETPSQNIDRQALEISVLKLSNRSYDELFNRMMANTQLGGNGFGWGGDWNSILFNAWIKTAQEDSDKLNKTSVARAADRLYALLKTDGKSPITKCVDKLIPLPSNIASDKSHRWWRERGLHLIVSNMSESPSSLLRLFPGSLGGVLPPPPTAIYSVNAVLGPGLVNVPSEAYYPGCTAYWQASSNVKNAFEAFNNAGKQSGSPFANLTKTPNVLREEILRSCSNNDLLCPFPIFDLVIDVHQVYCGGWFHWFIEVWPRVAPFLEALLADDMPKFAIRIGCGDVKELHHNFYDLFGLDSSKVELIGTENVFAKEVIMPTEGFAHSPLLNYWNLVAAKNHVERRLSPVQHPGKNKVVLVIVRDASRRGDGHIYNQQFIGQLSADLPNHDITPFRSSNSTLMACLECQVRAFMSADFIIGSHGAGLSHIMFAKSSGAVLERIVNKGDSGIYAELSFILGLKYFPMDQQASVEAYRDTILFADSYW